MNVKTPQILTTAKRSNPTTPLAGLFSMVASVVIAGTGSVSAANFTWTGGGADDSFSNGNNWGGTAPVSANTNALFFDGSVRPAPDVDITNPFLVNTLTFTPAAGSFAIGGNDIQLDAASAGIIQNSPADQAIGSTVRIVNGNAAISGTGTGALTLAEVKNFTSGRLLTVSRDVAIASLTADGSAALPNLTLSGPNGATLTLGSMTAGSGGYGSFSATAVGSLNRLNVTASGSYGFTGMLTDTTTFGGAANVLWTVGTAGWSMNGSGNKTITFVDAGTKQFDSSLFLSNNTTNSRQITFSVSGGDVTLNGQIRDSNAGTGPGANGIVKSGTGRLILANAGANSDFSGAVTVNQGTLVVAANNALGTSAGSTSVASGATLGFQGNADYSTEETVTAAGTGVNGAGAIRNLSGTNRFVGAIGLTTATTVGADTGTLTLEGAITGGQNLTKTGAGTVVLTNAANAFGTITISAGTLESKAQGAIGTAAPAIGANGTLSLTTADQNLTYDSTTFGGPASTVNVAASRTAIFSGSSAHSKTGFTKTGPGTLEFDGNKGFFGGGATANQTVWIGQGTAIANRTGGSLIAGTSIADATPLVIGDGTNPAKFQNGASAAFQISTFSAVTINANGTLDTNGVSGSLSSITMNGGAITTGTGILTLSGTTSAFTFTGNSTATISGRLRLLAGATSTFTIANGAAGTDVSIAASIDNITSPVMLAKAGPGTLELIASNSYTGSTTVGAGVLLANNPTGSATGASAVEVAGGATLGGTGKVSGATTISGILAPGNGIGTITVANNVTWNAGDAWKFELGTAAASLSDANGGTSTQDLLNITGGSFLKGAGSGWSFDFQGTGAPGWYKLAQWTGSTDFAAADFGSPLQLGSGLSGLFTVDGGTSALYS